MYKDRKKRTTFVYLTVNVGPLYFNVGAVLDSGIEDKITCLWDVLLKVLEDGREWGGRKGRRKEGKKGNE